LEGIRGETASSGVVWFGAVEGIMGEGAYRLFKAILLTILVVAGLIIGWRYAETGRYVQIDPRKRPEGGGPIWRMDTRTGEVLINE
jgi:hypothetical protein